MKSKNTFKGHVDLSLIGEEDKRHYVLIKDFSTFMYDHTLNRGTKYFVVIFYNVLSQKKYWYFMLMIALKLMINKKLRYLKNASMLESKIMEEK